jgi:hypothetical protein
MYLNEKKFKMAKKSMNKDFMRTGLYFFRHDLIKVALFDFLLMNGKFYIKYTSFSLT